MSLTNSHTQEILSTLKDISSHPNFTFIKGHISDREHVDVLFSEYTNYVINFAAESHVDRSISDPDVFIKSNIMGVQVLLEACRNHNTQRYLQVSTDEVHGSLGDTGLFTEDTL